MKKIISFALAACMLLSIVPMASAARDYTQGTQVVYTSSGTENYTITVPALLAPGGDGTVTLSGTWAENRVITVTAESTVTLKNSIKETDTKTLNVNFDGISEAGNNTGSQTFTESVSVDSITNALFGTWSGKFNYNVEISNLASETGCDTLYWDGSTDGKLVVEAGDFTMVKIADNLLTPSDAPNGFTIITSAYGSEEIPFESIQEMYDEYGVIGVSLFVSTPVDNYNFVGIATLPERGVWVASEPSGRFISITIPGYTGFPHSEHCGH